MSKVKLEIFFDMNVERDVSRYHAINELLVQPPENMSTNGNGQINVAVYSGSDPETQQAALNNMVSVPNVAPILQDQYGQPTPPPTVDQFKQQAAQAAAASPPAIAPPAAPPAPAAMPPVAAPTPPPATVPPAAPPAAPPADDQAKANGLRIRQLIAEAAKVPNMTVETAKQYAMQAAGVTSFTQMTPAHGPMVIQALEQLLAQSGAPPTPPQAALTPPPAPQPPQPAVAGAAPSLI